MAEPRDGPPPLPSAGEDLARAQLKRETLQTQSPSYRLAFADQEFLLRDELRPVRLQLELLKPELLLSEHRIDSTVVVFGSARIPSPEAAAAAPASAAACWIRSAPTRPRASSRAWPRAPAR
jgi:hypothetical protein